MARGPKRSSFGPFRIHVPRPRLQSNLTLTLPLLVKATVYLVLSSGVSTAPSPPWNGTSCHDVSPIPPSWSLGADEQPAEMPSVITSTRSRFMGGLLQSALHGGGARPKKLVLGQNTIRDRPFGRETEVDGGRANDDDTSADH